MNTTLVVSLTLSIATIAYFLIMYDFIENKFSGATSLLLRLKHLNTPYQTYEISNAVYETKNYKSQYKIAVLEDGVNVPIQFPEKIAETLYEIKTMNGAGTVISVNAKIDHRNLKLISLKGYMVKQQED